MEDFNSETDSDYTSYWRDWVSLSSFFRSADAGVLFQVKGAVWFLIVRSEVK